MILFNRWIIARVDRAVKLAEPSALCNGWILTDQDNGYRCTRAAGHAGFCDPDAAPKPEPPKLTQPDPSRKARFG